MQLESGQTMARVVVYDDAGNEQCAPIDLTVAQIADLEAGLPLGWTCEEL